MAQASSKKDDLPASAAVLLLPEWGTVPPKVSALRPSLKRGEGPRPPRCGWERSTWPHVQESHLSEVPLNYPSFKRKPRVLVQDWEETCPVLCPIQYSSRPVSPAHASSTEEDRSLLKSQAEESRNGLLSRGSAVSRNGLLSRGSAGSGFSGRSRGGFGSRAPSGSRGASRSEVTRDGFDSQGSFNGQVVCDDRDGIFGSWEASEFELGLFANNASDAFAKLSNELSYQEEASYFSSFCSSGSKRVRGEPLLGGTESAMSADGIGALGFPLPAAGPQDQSTQVATLAASLPKSGTINLEFKEPTHGVFRSTLKEEHLVSTVCGRPLCKGSIRTYIPPVSPPLAALQVPQNPQYNVDRMRSPPVSTLLRDSSSRETSRMTQSTMSVPSRPCTSTDKALASMPSCSDDGGESPLCWDVPDYFFFWIGPKDIEQREPLVKRQIKVPDPALLPKSASAPSLSKPTSYSANRAALARDMKDLRRAGNTTLAEGNKSMRNDLTLMDLCMVDRNDTAEALLNGINILKRCLVTARQHGAARHPTMAVSEKTLKVVERKYKLVEPLFRLMAGIEVVIKDPGLEAMVEKCIAGEDPTVALGHLWHDGHAIRDITLNGIHRAYPGSGDEYGKPELAEMGSRHTEGYQKRFGLSLKHCGIVKQAERMNNECAACAVIAAKRAKEIVKAAAVRKDPNPRSKEADAVSYLEALLEAIGVHEDHPSLTEVGRCKEAARAAAVLRFAETQFPAPPGLSPDTAYKAAVRVEDEVQAAYEFGVFPDHPDIMKAATVGHHLRAEGVLRFAKNTVQHMGKRLGNAEEAAIKIEAAIKGAIKLGVPVPTEELEEARKVAVGAREVEGLRRREANAEKRKAEAAAKAAA